MFCNNYFSVLHQVLLQCLHQCHMHQNIFFFKNGQIYMKDAECAESKEKSCQIFPIFIFRVMVIFVLKTANFRLIFRITRKLKIDFSFHSALCASFVKMGAKLRKGVCISLLGTGPSCLNVVVATHVRQLMGTLFTSLTRNKP